MPKPYPTIYTIMENARISGASIPDNSLFILFQRVGESYIDGFVRGKGSVLSTILNDPSLSLKVIWIKLARGAAFLYILWMEPLVPATVRLSSAFISTQKSSIYCIQFFHLIFQKNLNCQNQYLENSARQSLKLTAGTLQGFTQRTLHMISMSLFIVLFS